MIRLRSLPALPLWAALVTVTVTGTVAVSACQGGDPAEGAEHADRAKHKGGHGRAAATDGASLAAAGVGRLDRDTVAAKPRALLDHAGGRPGRPGGAPTGEAADADASLGLSWSFSPEVLRVYRDTAVSLKVDRLPPEHEGARCTWNFGDGTPRVDGCTVGHTFRGGQADQIVTLTLQDGPWTWRSVRTVPLERLPVGPAVGEGEVGASGAVPAPPAETATSFRLALIADTATATATTKGAGVPETVTAALRALAGPLRPGLVIHLGGLVGADATGQAWEHARQRIARPLAEAGVPTVWSTSPTDRAAHPAPPPLAGVQPLDVAGYPDRYTFTYKGAFFLVFGLDRQEDGLDEATLAWMREQLGRARVYQARFVVSYLPLHKLQDAHLGSLDKKFRLYEIFLRARVTALFSAGYRVYFRGRYGALPVVSVGALTPPGGKLAGTDFAQPTSLAVVDVVDGVPEHVFGVVGPTFDKRFDEGLLPGTVEVYTR